MREPIHSIPLKIHPVSQGNKSKKLSIEDLKATKIDLSKRLKDNFN